MTEHYNLLREFRTAQFRVIADWTEDSWNEYDETDEADEADETDETVRNLESGEWVCMLVRVRVLHNRLGEIGVDYLGKCIYKTPKAFMDHRECGAMTRQLRAKGSNAICSSSFVNMIHEAISAARETIADMRSRPYPYTRAVQS